MIKIITGPVKAGKSKKLIEYYNQLKDCGVMVFSSKFSLNDGEDIVSRYGTSIKAIPINSLFDIFHHISLNHINYILIDEFQFLQMTTAELKKFFELYGDDYHFYLFGLNLDYRRMPFKLTASAMAMADDIEFLNGYCDICEENVSQYSLRLENGAPAKQDDDGKLIILDGDGEETKVTYQTICSDCWRKIYVKTDD